MDTLESAACHWWVVRDQMCNKLPRGIELIVGRSIFESNIRLANSGSKSLRVATMAKQTYQQDFAVRRMCCAVRLLKLQRGARGALAGWRGGGRGGLEGRARPFNVARSVWRCH
jgi:hypothetical protein